MKQPLLRTAAPQESTLPARVARAHTQDPSSDVTCRPTATQRPRNGHATATQRPRNGHATATQPRAQHPTIQRRCGVSALQARNHPNRNRQPKPLRRWPVARAPWRPTGHVRSSLRGGPTYRSLTYQRRPVAQLRSYSRANPPFPFLRPPSFISLLPLFLPSVRQRTASLPFY
jgi:hypothetical protein